MTQGMTQGMTLGYKALDQSETLTLDLIAVHVAGLQNDTRVSL